MGRKGFLALWEGQPKRVKSGLMGTSSVACGATFPSGARLFVSPRLQGYTRAEKPVGQGFLCGAFRLSLRDRSSLKKLLRIVGTLLISKKAAEFSAAFFLYCTNLLFLTASIILTAEGASTTLMIISMTKFTRVKAMTMIARANIPPTSAASSSIAH